MKYSDNGAKLFFADVATLVQIATALKLKIERHPLAFLTATVEIG